MGLYTIVGIRRTNQPIRAPRFRPSGRTDPIPISKLNSSHLTTEEREREKRAAAARSMATTAGYLARRAAQKERVRLLYRRALKDTLNWAVHRHLFYQDVSFLPSPPPLPISSSLADLISSSSLEQASDLRDKFEANRSVEDPDVIDRLIVDAEARYSNFQHPDPYIVPWAPGGSKFTRNPPPPQGIEIVYNYGKED
ncbi:hypothetical protein PR202_gb28454 [Eleusine coracana subsp. coracana]|uniref:NADH dehydrogenase [ubiquinone] 1 beta subcomplex subunit 9 n=1 Tax=Eleusine coracana subsp. coracana TaxID=191504 RepID=A0AAV5FUF4_ELECO|nr:hypothetical protein PR202_gb28454 [Eleusine coracana subsp. coracana]